jgi:RTX calcium-binding nonapeptide repeat (4 copies)
MLCPARALIVLVAGLGLGAGEAQAATVSLVPNTEIGQVSFTLRYVAAPGEANRLTAVESRDGRVWTFREAGATVQPGANCAAGGEGSIACTAPSTVAAPLTSYVVVDLGDGDDVVEVSAAHSGVGDLLAGAGNDRLRVRSGFVNASMGAGDDVARADGGQLAVQGGPGADRFETGRLGKLQVAYFASAQPVHVTTDGLANDGAAGEHDDVSRLVRTVNGSAHGDVLDARRARTRVALYGEGGDDRAFASPRGGFIEGSGRADVLHGGSGPDDLFGDEGADVLLGGGGDDDLRGGSGHDLLVGGRGHDLFSIVNDGRETVRARDGARDRVICDWVPYRLQVDRRDRLDRCAFPVAVSAQPPLTPHRRLALELRCPWAAPGGCRGKLVVFDSRPHPLGRAQFRLAAGAVRRLAVRLSDVPRDLIVSVIVADRRVRPPASQRTTVWTLYLSPP